MLGNAAAAAGCVWSLRSMPRAATHSEWFFLRRPYYRSVRRCSNLIELFKGNKTINFVEKSGDRIFRVRINRRNTVAQTTLNERTNMTNKKMQKTYLTLNSSASFGFIDTSKSLPSVTAAISIHVSNSVSSSTVSVVNHLKNRAITSRAASTVHERRQCYIVKL